MNKRFTCTTKNNLVSSK